MTRAGIAAAEAIGGGAWNDRLGVPSAAHTSIAYILGLSNAGPDPADLRRHTLRGARRILARDHCRIWLRFTGRARRPPSHVRRQSARPGTALYAGDRLVVQLR